jgi:hypothetical protein
MITAQVVTGVKSASDTAVKVTVKKTINASFSTIFSRTGTNETIVAIATAEIVSVATGPQPCLFAIEGDGDGVTTGNDLTLTGSANFTSSDCSVLSDAGIKLTGSSTINAEGTYAAGTISTSGSATITGGTYQNSSQISDPYATFAPLQTEFAALSPGQGSAINVTGSGATTLNPGTYSSLSVTGSGTVTINPGLYIINGDVNLGGSATITGNGITIISSGTLSDTGSSSVTISAPRTGSTHGGIPGVLFASRSTSDSSFTGSTSLPFAGLIYYPNGTMAFSGGSTPGSTGCSEVVAGTIKLTGSSNLSVTGCASYGTQSFGSLPSTTSVALVQ